MHGRRYSRWGCFLALGTLVSGCGGSSGGGSPTAIQPQPIPEDGFADAIDPTSVSVISTGGAIVVKATVSAPAPVGPAAGVGLTVLDATNPTSLVAVKTDAAGRISATLPGATASDAVFLAFDGDDSGAASVLFQGGTVTPSCVRLASAPAIELGDLTVGMKVSLDAGAGIPTGINGCASDVVVDGVSIVGDLTAPSLPQSFTAKVGGDTRIAFEIVAPRAGSLRAYLVFREGARRHVIMLHATAH